MVEIGYKVVVEAIEKVAASGQSVTIARVRDELGQGSPQTISKFVKLWKEQKIAEIQNDLKTDNQQKQLDFTEEKPKDETKVAVERNIEPQNTVKDDVPSQAKPQEHIPNKQNKDHTNKSYDKPRHGQKHRPAFKEEDQFITKPIESMTPEEISIAIRRLQSAIVKEQIRRETAQKMATEAKEYSSVIKEQVAQRINELKLSMEEQINQLKAEAKELKLQADDDLKFYREQLDKANKKIIAMTEDED